MSGDSLRGGDDDPAGDGGDGQHSDGHHHEDGDRHHEEEEQRGHTHDHGGNHDNGGNHDHDRHHHHDLETVRFAVVTVSSSRTMDDDPAGDAIVDAIEGDGGEVTVRNLVGDSYDGVQGEVDTLVSRDDVDAVVTTGGTGVTPDDVTVEAVRPLFEKELPGFGELFRRLSYDEIGTKVVATRAVAGVADGVPVFCIPGSENAARLGANEIIVPQAGHLAGLAKRDGDEGEEANGGSGEVDGE